MFVALGLSGVIPAGHFVITDGLSHAFNYAALGWVILMAFLYIIGAVVYAARVPERIWPGRFDIWVGRPPTNQFSSSSSTLSSHLHYDYIIHVKFTSQMVMTKRLEIDVVTHC